MSYLFTLGNNDLLSLAELTNIGVKNLQQISPKNWAGNIENSINPKLLQSKLGGTIKICEIIERDINKNAALEKIAEEIYKNREKKKVVFGLNFLSENNSSKNREIENGIKKIKNFLKNKGINSRYLNKGAQNVNNIIISKELAKGGQIFEISEKNILLKIIAIQNVDEYSLRDYRKPFRDAKAGMIPPKLAQIMLNIAVGENNLTGTKNISILDPFCGTGTIVCEALLNGFTVYGCDKDEKMVNGTMANCNFLKEKIAVDLLKLKKIWKQDVTTTFPNDLSIDIIVTENHLGNNFSKIPEKTILEKENQKLSKLYLKFFKNIKNILIKGKSKVVICFPFLNQGENNYSFSGLIKEIEKIGFKSEEIIPKHFSLRYAREDQLIGREIKKFNFN